MFSLFKKEKWVHVKTLEISGIFVRGAGNGKVFIHLLESDKNKRKMETNCTFPEITQNALEIFVKSTELYNNKIHRWLNGRYDPEIPKYSDISEEDIVNALRGRIG